MVTINPADCDRTTVYTGECRNFSDTAWVPFQSGRRRAPDAPDYQWLVDSGTGSFWTRDTHVRNLVRLVPAGADAARRRRAHSIVEAERDEARESLRRLRNETDFALFTVRDQLKQCRGERERMTRERDEWKFRAEAAEARTAPTVLLYQPDGTHMDASHLPIAPGVTRAGIEKAVRSGMSGLAAALGEQCITEAVDAVHALISGDDPVDPVEEKARELYRAATPDARWETVADEYRRIAAYVLGQESGR